MHRALLLCCLLPCLPPSAARAADPVTVYRCTDATGRVSLGSTPCEAGQRQEVRSLQRPTDGAPPAPPAPRPVTPAPAPAVATVAPRPLYDCVRPDGTRYDSESAEGDPRYVPLWTLGYPAVVPRTSLGDRIGGTPPRPEGRGPGGPSRPPPERPGVPYAAYGVAGGTWVRDDCFALPPAEVCARLADRRDAIRRRAFNAQQRERDTLRLEERGVVARLAGECGVR